ncbi:hypothetical protein D6764_00030 [Candidatus Woesearchaeota archaeon]|nr:MAG: hypothetical protein D6764_00030 [Candidatus Woesearchaeota archaeon]
MRKGSLQLSVNAIVVLVLAITMLGMGLAFTKGKFAELGERIEVPEPDYPATQDDPIVLPVNEIKLKSGKQGGFSVNFYNEGNTRNFYACVVCGTTYSLTTNTLRTVTQVKSGDYETFKILFTNPGGTGFPPDGTNICKVGFVETTNAVGTEAPNCQNGDTYVAAKQIVIKVQ